MVLLTSSLIIGFIRLCLIVLFVFYLYKKFLRVSPLNFLDFIVQNWFRYGTAYLLIALILTQLNAYNLFNCFYVFVFLLCIDIIGLKNIRQLKQYFGTNVKIVFLQALRSVEQRKPLKQWITLHDPIQEEEKQHNKLVFMLVVVLAVFTFLSRYFYINYDNYSLSDPWIIDLERLIRIDNQQWFGQDFNPIGELAVLNFYAKIANISPEIALQFASILEAILLSIVLFWTMQKITTSKFIAPLIGTLYFVLVYVLSPVNVYYLLQTNSILMALTFAIPTFIYAMKPELLKMSPTTFYTSFFVAFFAIGLTDFFVFFIVMPMFLVVLLLVSIPNQFRKAVSIMACYIAAVLVYLIMYQMIAQSKQLELASFFKTNMVSMSAYSYFPQLIVPLKTIVKYLQYGSIVAFVLALSLQLLKIEKLRCTLLFLLFFNAIIVLAEMKYSWVDVEKIKVLFIVLFPLIIGLLVALVLYVFQIVTKPLSKLQPLSILLILVTMVFYSFKYQEEPIKKLKKADVIPKEILFGYDKIAQVFYNNTYTIVNDPSTQVISTNRHGFMNYDYFIANYLTKDSIYDKNKKNKLFLSSNPDVVLPKSVLVFVINATDKKEHNLYADNAKLTKTVLNTLQQLKQRGRTIQIFYQSNRITIYEIINVPGASKMRDLVFTKR
jgi:hypothetical protein